MEAVREERLENYSAVKGLSVCDVERGWGGCESLLQKKAQMA